MGVQNFEFQFNFFGGKGGGQKKEYFFRYDKIGLVLGSFLGILWSFLKVKVQNGDIFGGVAKISNIFWGA